MSNGGAGAAAVRPPRHVRAPNASPLTLDGTRTYLVGVDQLAIIDPGPALPDHLSKVTKAVGDARVVTILLTHGHPDHAAAAAPLSARLHAPVRSLAAGTLQPGDVVGWAAYPSKGRKKGCSRAWTTQRRKRAASAPSMTR